MKSVLQRVTSATVSVDSSVIGRTTTPRGLLVLVGVARGDTESDAETLADKTCGLRIFEDDAGKMNLSVLEVGGSILAVSQFTLLADTKKGRRPSFTGAMEPAKAEALFERFCEACRARGISVETGRFGASMQVELVNDGPVTILLDTASDG